MNTIYRIPYMNCIQLMRRHKLELSHKVNSGMSRISIEYITIKP